MNRIILVLSLVFVSLTGNTQPVSVDQLPESSTRFFGENANNELGFAVVPIGNFNGDSRLDYAISDPINDRVLVVNPRSNAAQINLDNLLLTRNGFTVSGNSGTDFGVSLSAIGDFNQDGFDDLAIGAQFDGEGGKIYVLAGTNRPRFDVTISDEDEFILIVEGTPGELLGQTIGKQANLNQDRFTDLLIPSEFRSSFVDNDSRFGAYHVIYGDSSFPQKTAPVDVLDSTSFLTIIAPSFEDAALSQFGSLIEPVGDVTGDGIEDIAFFGGVDLANGSSSIRIIPGGNRLIGNQPFERLLFPTQTLTFSLFEESLMHQVRSMAGGDINNDGKDELIVGFPLADLSGGIEPKGALAIISDASGLAVDAFTNPNVDWYGHWKSGSQFGQSLDVRDETIAVGAPFADSVFGDQFNAGAVYTVSPATAPSGNVFPNVHRVASGAVYGATGNSRFGANVFLVDSNTGSKLELFSASVGDKRVGGSVALRLPVVEIQGDFDQNQIRNHRDLIILSNSYRSNEAAVNLVQDATITNLDILQWQENRSTK